MLGSELRGGRGRGDLVKKRIKVIDASFESFISVKQMSNILIDIAMGIS